MLDIYHNTQQIHTRTLELSSVGKVKSSIQCSGGDEANTVGDKD